MAIAFPRLSYWVWGEKPHENSNNPLSSSSDFPSGYREPDSLNFTSKSGSKIQSSRKTRKDGSMVDREYDVVLVPSDGGSYSDCESEGSDWSVGWMEPHGPEFGIDSESFAVLVPCYGRGKSEKVEGMKNGVLASVHSQNIFPSDDKDFIEQWLDSLQKM